MRSILLFLLVLFLVLSVPLALHAQQGQDLTATDSTRGSWRSVNDSMQYQQMLFNLLTAYQAQSDSVLSIAERALKSARERITGGDHENLADATANLGFFLDASGQTSAARPYYIEALEMRGRLHKSDHPALAQAMNNMAYFFNKSGEPEKAEPLFVEAMEMKRRIYGGDHAEVAIGLNNLAVFHDNLGHADEAGAYYAESLAMYRRLYAADAAELITPLVNLAYFLTTQGDFRESEDLYVEALGIYEKHFQDDVREEIILLKNNLAYLYERIGRLQDAEQLMVDVLDLARDFYDGDHPAVATAINNLASHYHSRGMDAEAEPLYRESLQMRRRLHKDTHPDVLLALNNMGYFNLTRGRLEEAERLFLEAGQLLATLHPGDHAQRAMHLNNLASLYAEQGRNAEAETLYVDALEMVKRLHRHPHPEIGRQHNNLGTLYRDQERHEEARQQFTLAVREYRALKGASQQELAVALGNLGRVTSDLGAFGEGEALLWESWDIKRSLYDDGHSELIASARIMAQMYIRQGATEHAREQLEELISHLEIAIRQSFGFESETHQLTYMNTVLKPNLDLLTQFCLRNADTDRSLAGLLMQSLVRFKGAVANESARRSAEWSKNRHAAEIRDRLTALREQDAALASRQHSAALLSERARVQRTADSLDAVLRKLDREYDKLRQRQEADWADVRRQLRRDEAIVEFVAAPYSFLCTDDADTLLYAAVILRRQGDPEIVTLTHERALRRFIEADMHPNGSSYIASPSEAHGLYALLWKPMESALSGVSTVYLVPDGVLHRLSFHALVVDTTETPRYLDDQYRLHFLTSARALLSRNVRYRPSPYRQPEHGVLVGDPLFSAIERREGEQGGRAESMVSRGGKWTPLPGTRIEVEGIAKVFQKMDIPCTVMMGNRAQEAQIKALSGDAPRILHIATHGFFFEVPRPGAPRDKLRLITRSGGQQLRIEDNPMLRAGLVLSGGNEVWTGKAPHVSSDDGILSALEISRLDLAGTELVTLSACETGLGDITNGEGIFGLQRAFQVAGAARILMSLWKVADEPTAHMMKLFYMYWLQDGDPDAAFRRARKEMRNTHPQPFFWAGFVMIED